MRVWVAPIAGLIVVAALVVLLNGGPKPATPAATSTASTTVNVFSVNPTTVTQITISAAGKTLTLVAKPAAAPTTGTASASASASAAPTTTTAWAIGSETGQTADAAKVQSLMAMLSPLQATRSLGVVTNPATFGLGKPATVLKVTEKDGTLYTLDVGSHSPVGGYYATTGGGKVYLIASAVQQALLTNPSQWLPAATSTATAGG